MIFELEIIGILVVIMEGRCGGIFVVKELVYVYVMWVSLKFYFVVIWVYDVMVSEFVDDLVLFVVWLLLIVVDVLKVGMSFVVMFGLEGN